MAVPSLHILDYSSDDGEKEYKLKADLIVHINAEFTARHRDLMEGSTLLHARPEEVFSRFEAEYKRLTANYTPAELRELTDMGNPVDRFENQDFAGDGGFMEDVEEDAVNLPVVVDLKPTKTAKPKRRGPVPSRKLRKKTGNNTKVAAEDPEVIETDSNVIIIPSTPIAPVRHRDYDLSSPDLSEAEDFPSVNQSLENSHSTNKNLLVGVCIPFKQKSPSHSPPPQAIVPSPQLPTRQPKRIRSPSSSVIINHFPALYKRKLKSSRPRVYMKKKIGINALIDKCYRSRRIDEERGFPSKCPAKSFLGRNLRKGTLAYYRLYPANAAKSSRVSAKEVSAQQATRGRKKRKT